MKYETRNAVAVRRQAGIDALSIAEAARAAAEAKKALDVVLLDVHELTIIADYFVLASGTTSTHVKAITDAILEELKDRSVLPLHREGTVEAGWIILDYADTVVHVFHVREREYYDLERLYRGARTLKSPATQAASPATGNPTAGTNPASGS
ncbi:MAG: ribosome silencing factor [Bacillota bacterium]